jgi:hypothetical protein
MATEKIIYCPNCKRRVAVYDGKSTINVVANCKKCKKKVVFHVDTLETEIKNISQRTSASGKTFR